MNIDKVGNFISERRKAKKLTQEKLAEKLNISDRAISKWERGICLPDASIMIPLCEILDINVNELLSGEMLNEKEYNKKSEELLLELKRLEEEKNDRVTEIDEETKKTIESSSVKFIEMQKDNEQKRFGIAQIDDALAKEAELRAAMSGYPTSVEFKTEEATESTYRKVA